MKRLPITAAALVAIALLGHAATPTTSTTTAPVLVANPNQIALEAGIYQYFLGVQSLDPQQFASSFAPDGTLEDPGGSEPVRGRAAIAATYGGALQVLGRITPRIRDMFVGVGTSTEVTVRWTLIAYTKAGKQVVVEGIGIFKFRPFQPGERMLLESVREFYDPIQFAAQLM